MMEKWKLLSWVILVHKSILRRRMYRRGFVYGFGQVHDFEHLDPLG